MKTYTSVVINHALFEQTQDTHKASRYLCIHPSVLFRLVIIRSSRLRGNFGFKTLLKTLLPVTQHEVIVCNNTHANTMSWYRLAAGLAKRHQIVIPTWLSVFHQPGRLAQLVRAWC